MPATSRIARSWSLFWEVLGRGLAATVRPGRSDRLRHRPPKTGRPAGISIGILTARPGPELEATLESLDRAIGEFDGPVELVIVATVPDLPEPQFKHPVGVCSVAADATPAAMLGVMLQAVRYDWCFPLQCGSRLDSGALAELWRWRDRRLFALSCRVGKVPAVTGPTGYMDCVETVTGYGPVVRPPLDLQYPVHHAVAQLGLSLFDTDCLVSFTRPAWVYDQPGGLELEWAVQSAKSGLGSLFVPAAKIVLAEPVSIQSDSEQAVLRNRLPAPPPGLGVWLNRPRPVRRALSLVATRRRIARLPGRLPVSTEKVRVWRLRESASREQLPWVIWVTPYRLYPLLHGGARRMYELSLQLTENYRLAVISDEGLDYCPDDLLALAHIDELHLIMERNDRPIATRSTHRIHEHCNDGLQQQLERSIHRLRPAAVDLQYEELLGLVRPPRYGERWIASLHDVNFDTLSADAGQSRIDAYVERLLKRTSGIIACSPEDRALLTGVIGNKIPIALVENGVNRNEFRRIRPSTGDHLVFVGPFRYGPNIHGIRRFLQRVYPRLLEQRPTVSLSVVTGDGGPAQTVADPLFRQPGVRVIGAERDVPGLLAASTLQINPVEGVRGSCLKTIETLAAGRVCVATEDAARGLLHLKPPGLVCCKSVDAMLPVLLELLQDTERRHRLETANDEIVASFDWSVQGRRLQDFYRRLRA